MEGIKEEEEEEEEGIMEGIKACFGIFGSSWILGGSVGNKRDWNARPNRAENIEF